LGGVVEKVIAAGEAFVEFGDTPWSDDFDSRLDGVEGELEADLVVAFMEELLVVSLESGWDFKQPLPVQPCEASVQEVF